MQNTQICYLDLEMVKGKQPTLSDSTYLKFQELSRTVAQLYLFPKFYVNNSMIGKMLSDIFYDVAIELSLKLKIKDDKFKYYIGNFDAHCVDSMQELIGFLKHQKESSKGNQTIYEGFRSIYFILWQNIEVIDVDYIDEINKKLEPFYQYDSRGVI